MKKNAFIALIIFTLTLTYYAVSKDLLVTYDGGILTIPLKTNSNVDILSANGNVTAQTDETALALCTQLFSAAICSGSGGGSAPAITGFSASPTSVTSGGSSTISWTLANTATSCIKTGSWSGTLTGSLVSDGSHSEVVTNITTSSTYNLQCSNTTGSSAVVSTSVSVVGSANCTAFPPILGGAVDTSVYANGSANGGNYSGKYANIYLPTSNFPFPGISGNKWHFSLTKNKYITSEFTIDNNALGRDGTIQFVLPTNFEGPPTTATSVSISECPGDFSFHSDQPRCLVKGGAVPSLFWSTKSTATSASKCKLVQGKTYYLNFVHANNTENNNFATSKCPNAVFCGILGQNSFSDQ